MFETVPRLSRRRLTALLAALAAPWPGPGRAPRAEDGAGALKILFCGDSLAQGLYLTLQPLLRRRGRSVLVNGTKHATGLTRSDDHDWVTVVPTLLTGRPAPDLVVFWIGANDFGPLVDRGRRLRFAFGSPGFAGAYGEKVGAMVEAATAAGAAATWVGLPNMRSGAFAEAARQLNSIQEAAAREHGALWVPTWDATSDPEGNYRAALPGPDQVERRLRAEDGVHFSDFGYRRVAALAFQVAGEQRPAFGPLAEYLATDSGR